MHQVVDDFEQQMREAVNEEHEGKRRNETNWKIHRIHWEKNRFFYDLMYVRKVMSRELVCYVNVAVIVCFVWSRLASPNPRCMVGLHLILVSIPFRHTQTV